LKELKELQNLKWLQLGHNTEVTDAALKELKEFKKLGTLILRGTNNVTDKGVKELQSARPEFWFVQ
jgi:hypothetical protein